MIQGLSGWHAIIILVIVLLIFGAPRLPQLARSLGESIRIFRNETRSTGASDDSAGDADSNSQADAQHERNGG